MDRFQQKFYLINAIDVFCFRTRFYFEEKFPDLTIFKIFKTRRRPPTTQQPGRSKTCQSRFPQYACSIFNKRGHHSTQNDPCSTIFHFSFQSAHRVSKFSRRKSNLGDQPAQLCGRNRGENFQGKFPEYALTVFNKSFP